MLEAWLSARDADSLRSAWNALAPQRHEFTPPTYRRLTLHGAAQLAASMLGERPEWILDPYPSRPPDYQSGGVVDACFVDAIWDVRSRCYEDWQIWEQRDGTRGVQLLRIGCGSADGRPEGGSNVAVRVFDRDRAASICIDGTIVCTIGAVDLSPLDLYSFSQYYEAPPSPEGVIALRRRVAELAAELDPLFATSATWPEVAGPIEATAHGAGPIERAFVDGERSVAIRVDSVQRRTVTVAGLPWGHELAVQDGTIYGRLPDAAITRVIARLEAIARLR